MERPETTTIATTTEPASEPLTPQTLVGGYPLWVVGLVLGLAVVLALWLLARAFRILAALIALGVVAGATWIAWQHVFG